MQEITINFNRLGKKIEEIFMNINTNVGVRIVHENNQPWIYIVFGKTNIRSTIRIYPTDNDDVYIYAIGNRQQNIIAAKLLERFTHDLENILILFEKNIITAPIDALPEFKKQRQMEIANIEDKIEEIDKNLTALPMMSL